jgi:EmrB/QacA subfamily drug resistance transporter
MSVLTASFLDKNTMLDYHSRMMKIVSMPYKWLALFTVSISAFLSSLDISIVNISFPILTKTFAVEPSVVLWVTVVYLLVSVSLMLTAGKLGDLLGQKKIYVVGFGLFTIGLALCSLSQSITHLILSRMVQGAGAAMMISLGTAIVVTAFPTTERGKALGILGAVFSGGSLTGPALGGFLLDSFDWSAIFYARVPIGIIGTVMAWTLLKEQCKRVKRFQFDWWGAVALCIALSCLLLFFNLSGKLGYLAPLVLALAGVTALFMVLFIIHERRASEPTVDLNLFKNPLFASGNISLGFMFFAFGSYTFLMPFYLIDGLGRSALQTGLIIAVVAFTSLVIAPLSGWLSDKIGSRLLCTVGITCICLALFLFSRLSVESKNTEVALDLVLFGLGSGLFQSPNNSSIIAASPKNRLGTASAMIVMTRQVSISLGIAVSGTVFAGYQLSFASELVRNHIDPSVIGRLSLISGFQSTLLLVSMICTIGIFTSLIHGKPQTSGYDLAPKRDS